MRNPLFASLLAASLFALGAAGTFAAEGGTIKTGKKAEFGRAAEGDAVKSGRKAEFGRAAEGDAIRGGRKAEFGRAADAGNTTTK
jgi:hypothetical protein